MKRVAIIHDWLPLYGGAERVLEQMLCVFPEADLFSMIDAIPESARGFLQHKPVQTSFVQRLPGAKHRYRSYLPLMPLAVEQFDLRGYDLVISNSYAVAKGVLTGPDQLHVCYCCSPIRYAWDLQAQYLKEAGLSSGFKAFIVKSLLHYIRLWDNRTAHGVDDFLTLSRYIARRIRKTYRREATVIYPPVDVEQFSMTLAKEDFYLTASRMVPYKRIDLIVEAFARMPKRRLVVIGDGPEWKKVQACARGAQNVELLGYQDNTVLRDRMQRARAFVFAAEEDFGIVPVEAQACGTPVIAYGRGGATETVVEGVTGLFFREQTVEALIDAVERFGQREEPFDPAKIRAQAERFSAARFRTEFCDHVEAKWAKFAADVRRGQ